MILISQRPLEIPLTDMLPMTILKQLVFNNVFPTRNSRKIITFFSWCHQDLKLKKKCVQVYLQDVVYYFKCNPHTAVGKSNMSGKSHSSLILHKYRDYWKYQSVMSSVKASNHKDVNTY